MNLNIVDKRERNFIGVEEFGNLRPGVCFHRRNNYFHGIYMKISHLREDATGRIFNCIDLDTLTLSYMNQADEVIEEQLLLEVTNNYCYTKSCIAGSVYTPERFPVKFRSVYGNTFFLYGGKLYYKLSGENYSSATSFEVNAICIEDLSTTKISDNTDVVEVEVNFKTNEKKNRIFLASLEQGDYFTRNGDLYLVLEKGVFVEFGGSKNVFDLTKLRYDYIGLDVEVEPVDIGIKTCRRKESYKKERINYRDLNVGDIIANIPAFYSIITTEISSKNYKNGEILDLSDGKIHKTNCRDIFVQRYDSVEIEIYDKGE